MSRPTTTLRLLAASGAVALLLSACGSASTSTASNATAGAAVPGAPSWCGSKKVTLGLTDGFGGNSWRLVTTASAKDEIAKCPSVTGFTYADGQGDIQKAISDIQGLVAKGVNALVVFPDAGNAMLPALQSAKQAGVTTVPYRVNPGGTDGKDYDVWVGADFVTDGKNWAQLDQQEPAQRRQHPVPRRARRATARASTSCKGLEATLDRPASTSSSAQKPFEVTNWDPAKTQQVLTRRDRQEPEDRRHRVRLRPVAGRRPSRVREERPARSRRSPHRTGTCCRASGEQHKDKNPDFKLFTVATGNDNARLAVDWAVALATGGTPPATKQFEAPTFEDSVSSKPQPGPCQSRLPGDVYLSGRTCPARSRRSC